MRATQRLCFGIDGRFRHHIIGPPPGRKITIGSAHEEAADALVGLARLRGWRVFVAESRDGRRRVEVTL